MRHLNEEEVVRVVVSIENGISIRQVARNFNVSPSIIHRVWNRYVETGGYKRRIGQGRKRKTNRIQDRFLVLSSLRSRISTAKDLQIGLRAVHNVEISDQTLGID